MQIIFAREYLKDVRMKPDQVKYLVTNARNGMCQGHRAELFAVKAAKCCAALAVSPLCATPAVKQQKFIANLCGHQLFSEACSTTLPERLDLLAAHHYCLLCEGRHACLAVTSPGILEGTKRTFQLSSTSYGDCLEHSRRDTYQQLQARLSCRSCGLALQGRPTSLCCVAFQGRDYVSKEDLQTAINLVILPRALLKDQQDQQPDDQQPPPPPPPPPPPQDQQEDQDDEDDKQDEEVRLLSDTKCCCNILALHLSMQAQSGPAKWTGRHAAHCLSHVPIRCKF